MATNESATSENVENSLGVGVVKEEGGTDPRPNSPDPSCPICLDDVIDAATTEMCGHRFCFNCLSTWSRVKPECPLCKQRFSLIIHNIRSWAEYDLLPVAWPEPPTPPLDANFFISLAFQRPRFRYRTTGGGWSWRMQDVIGGPSSTTASNSLLPSSSLHNPLPPNTLVPSHSYSPSNITTPPSFPPPHTSYMGNTVATEWRRRRQVCAVEFRRNIYRQNMWVCPTQPRPGAPIRVRDCTPSFFRNNSAQVHRLIPWLHRELLVLLDVCYDYLEVCQMICHAITNVSIRSQSFHSMLWPYLRERTSHFCHEFYHFASSPYDMLAYDLRAEYVRRSPPGFEVPALSDRENNSDSSDIEVIEPENRDDPIEISDEEVVRVEVTGNDSDASVEIISTLPPLAERQPEVINLVDDSSSDMEVEPSIPSNRPSCSKEKGDQRLRNKDPPFYKDESSSSTDIEIEPFTRTSCSEERRDRVCPRLRNKEPPVYKDDSSSSIDAESKPSISTPRPGYSAEDRRLGDRLRNRELQFYKDGSSSSEEEATRRKQLRKRKKRSIKPLKKRKRIIENYSSSDDEEQNHEDSDNINLDKETRSKTKSNLPCTPSSHISQEIQNDKSSSSSLTGTSNRSRTDCRTSPQPSANTSRVMCRDRKRSSESHNTGADFQVKFESNSSQNFNSPPSTPNISPYLTEFSEPKQEEIDNFLTSSIVQLFPPLNHEGTPLLDDHLINSYSSRSPTPPKPRLKSVVRKVEPDEEAGCSNWHSHNLRQRKFTSHAYTPYFSLSDSES